MTRSIETPQKFKRSKKLIEPRIQIRFGLVFLAMAGVAALVQSTVMGYFLTGLASEMPTDGLKLRTSMPQVLGTSFLVTFCMLAPLMIIIGIRSTFKIVGPLYRFRVHLRGVLARQDSQPCRIRSDDELQDFCSLLNQVTAPLREGIETEGAVDPSLVDQGTGQEQPSPAAPLPSALPSKQPHELS
jgi:hypothetical protein